MNSYFERFHQILNQANSEYFSCLSHVEPKNLPGCPKPSKMIWSFVNRFNQKEKLTDLKLNMDQALVAKRQEVFSFFLLCDENLNSFNETIQKRKLFKGGNYSQKYE